MMASTHALVGFVLGAAATALGLPGPLAAASAVGGSLAPDLDLYYGHRRTLHYPLLFPAGAVVVGATAVLSGGSTALFAATLAIVAAAVHVWMDVLGSGLELRPWEGNSDRAVYDHVRGRWIAPRRWVAYDGSPGDLALAGAMTVVAAPFYEGVWVAAMVALVAVSVAYVLLRRRLATLASLVADRLPASLESRVPARYLE